jgi:phage major head subunit gpT-like protein
LEWQDLISAIQRDDTYNEVERGVKASLVTAMGRMSAHTGQVITYDAMLNCAHEFAPLVDQLTLESDAPVMPFEDGSYPIPEPGVKIDREY